MRKSQPRFGICQLLGEEQLQLRRSEVATMRSLLVCVLVWKRPLDDGRIEHWVERFFTSCALESCFWRRHVRHSRPHTHRFIEVLAWRLEKPKMPGICWHASWNGNVRNWWTWFRHRSCTCVIAVSLRPPSAWLDLPITRSSKCQLKVALPPAICLFECHDAFDLTWV